jgi:hypothetical protein
MAAGRLGRPVRRREGCRLLTARAIALLLTLLAPGGVRDQIARSATLPWCEVDSDGKCALYGASIVQLLARPEVFDGKKVRVTGFIHFEEEGNGIYLHQEDYQRHLNSNGLWVEVRKGTKVGSQCQDRYVLIEGVFHAADHGHMGLWNGAIKDVTRCTNWR